MYFESQEVIFSVAGQLPVVEKKADVAGNGLGILEFKTNKKLTTLDYSVNSVKVLS
jgi:hypothetical protein